MDPQTRSRERMHPPSRQRAIHTRFGKARDDVKRWPQTHLDDPPRSPLLATKHPLRPDETGNGINRTVDNIHGHDMGAVGIGVFVPHPDDDMRPRVAAEVRGDSGERLVNARRKEKEYLTRS